MKYTVFLCGKNLHVEWLGHMARICLTFQENAEPYSKVVVLFLILSAPYESSVKLFIIFYFQLYFYFCKFSLLLFKFALEYWIILLNFNFKVPFMSLTV